MMKQYKLHLFMVLTMTLLALSATAHDFEVDGIYYLKNGTEATVTYEGTSYSEFSDEYTGNVTIPKTVTYGGTTYTVTSIGASAFSGCFGLTSVTIPNSVTNIGKGAFQGCGGLTSVTIPNSVTSIGMYAFMFCSKLTSITIPNSVIAIGKGAFSGCSGLTSIKVESGNTKYDSRNNCNAIIETASNMLVAGCMNTTIPNSVLIIGGYAFYNYTELTSITIPNSVIAIGEWAFYKSGLTSITIPNSVSLIAYAAFKSCSGLTSITIPNSVTIIGGCAFQDCSGLTNVIIPNSVTDIGNYAFSNCSGLTSISIPNSVTTIRDYAFSGCGGLTSISIPNSVTTIGDYAFSGCSGLTSINIPNSVTSIGKAVFWVCTALTEVYSFIQDPSVVTTASDAFYLYPSDYSNRTLYVPAGTASIYQSDENWYPYFGQIVEMTQPESINITFADPNVKAICVANWDTNCDSELSRAEAARVTSLEMFFNANNAITSFDELQFFNGLTSIGGSAFTSCSKLISITIPNTVITIGNYAFNGAGLKSINIPNSVTSIGIAAFSSCKELTSIIVNCDNEKYDSRNNCNAIIETATNTLISGCQNSIIPNSVTSIGSYAFDGCKGMTEVSIPNSVTSIGMWAFFGCIGLTSVNLPNSVTSIGKNSFSNTGLTSVEIPNSVTSIERYAFQSCWGLKSVTIPNSVIEISNGVFWNCKYLTDVYSYIQDLSQVIVGDNLFKVPVSQGTFDYSGRTLHVPAGTLAAYQADVKWYPYFGQIVDDLNPDTPLGDVNGDLEVNIADINAVINIILGGNSSTSSADVNGDGEVNIGDVNALINIILSGL